MSRTGAQTYGIQLMSIYCAIARLLLNALSVVAIIRDLILSCWSITISTVIFLLGWIYVKSTGLLERIVLCLYLNSFKPSSSSIINISSHTDKNSSICRETNRVSLRQFSSLVGTYQLSRKHSDHFYVVLQIGDILMESNFRYPV